MPTPTEHIEQAARNRKTAELVREDGRYGEWAVAALFYQALHLVNAYLSQANVVAHDHKDRQKKVHLLLRPVAADYDELYLSGRAARYDCHRFSDREINDLVESADAVAGHLNDKLGRKGNAGSR